MIVSAVRTRAVLAVKVIDAVDGYFGMVDEDTPKVWVEFDVPLLSFSNSPRKWQYSERIREFRYRVSRKGTFRPYCGSAIGPRLTRFAYGCLNEGYVPDEGTGLAAILPPVRRFGGGGDREKLRAHVRELLQEWVERFSGLGGL